jgi:stearoyl-CoA desaturase (Delta-9 desaturase)
VDHAQSDEKLSRPSKIINLLVTVIPLLGFVLAVVLLWNSLIDWRMLALLVSFYFLTGFGISLGYHRHLTHRAFKAKNWLHKSLTVMGALALEGDPIAWVANHRRHHTYADQEGDPHSPHGHGSGVRATLRGLYHAHMGWLFISKNRGQPERFSRDLLEEPFMRMVSRKYAWFIVATLMLPALLGFIVMGFTWQGALGGLLWGGLVRIFLLHHVTYSINSLTHFWGKQPYKTKDQSRNLLWLALLSFGEGWHNNHHAFPTSARHGLRWWQIDFSAYLVKAMEKLGWIWDVVYPSQEKQISKSL